MLESPIYWGFLAFICVKYICKALIYQGLFYGALGITQFPFWVAGLCLYECYNLQILSISIVGEWSSLPK